MSGVGSRWRRPGPASCRALAACAALVVVPALGAHRIAAQAAEPDLRRPAAVVDLRTREGVDLLDAGWRYSDARIVPVEGRQPGPDLKPSGPPNRTWTVEPAAYTADFDDSAWEVLDPATLDARRTPGRLAFGWYRTSVTIPERVGPFDPTGSTAILEIVVDDYAEVWVDGELSLALGQRGGQVAAGFNAPNRVVLGRDLRPGRRIQVAVFGINAPLSRPPGNFVWVRSATLDFYPPGTIGRGERVAAEVVRRAPGLDAVVPKDLVVERVAAGFLFIEGPVWHPDGYLLFSDPNANEIYRWTPHGSVSVFRPKSGYTGTDIGEYGQPGSNGLSLDPQGRLVIAEHGNHRVTRLEPNGVLTVLAESFRGKRLNSPNDLVMRSDGALYFTDPPFGLPRFGDDPRKELPFSGVFLWKDGALELLGDELAGPNGIAFSPDERFLYVGNWDTARKVVMRYEVAADGRLSGGRVFYDMTGAPGEEAIDGVKVDRQGNVYVSGPGGLWILSPEGAHLGTIRLPEQPANFAWGDADGRTLYVTARTGLYRMRLNVPGVRPAGTGPVASR